MRLLLSMAALLAGAVLAAPAAAEPRVALVIGNGGYVLPSWKLANPANDTEAVAAKLAQLGFTVSKVVDADEDAFEDAVAQFRRDLSEAGPDAVGLFYYSGHGVQADGVNWLIPVDFRGQVLQDVYRDAVRLGDVLGAMQAAGNAANFVILDACRNDPLPRAVRGAGRGLAQEARQPGVLISYAAAPGQSALDGAPGAGDLSPFTSAFVALIETPLPATQVFQLIAGRVADLTEGAQQPWLEIGLVARSADDFFYFKTLDGAAAPEPAPADGPVMVSAEDAVAWNEASAYDTVAAYADYLARFPNGFWKNEARNRRDARTPPPIGTPVEYMPGDGPDYGPAPAEPAPAAPEPAPAEPTLTETEPEPAPPPRM